MKRYVEYKDSGIPWIGEIPKDWEVSALKYLTVCLDGKRVPIEASLRGDMLGDIPYWGAGNIVDYVNDFLFNEELVLLGEDGAPFFDKTRPVAFYINEKIWVNNHIHVLRPSNKIHAKYLSYVLNMVDYKEYINGSILNKLTQSSMNKIKIPFPPIRIQHAIANYLDHKTTAIDTLIADKQKLIDLLKEKQQAIISYAMTKGLDKTASMKDSGIGWIGEIPKHWEVNKLGYCAYVQTGPFGSQLHSEDYVEDGTPIITVEHFGEGVILHHNLPRVSKSDLDRLSKYSLTKNDLVFSRVGSVDRCVIVQEDENGWLFSGRCLRVRLKEYSNVMPEYINLFFSTKGFREYMLLVAVGSTMPSINTTILNNVPIVIPTVSEQMEIVSYSKNHIQNIQDSILSIQKQVDLIKKYRQSLISEAVTGKVAI